MKLPLPVVVLLLGAAGASTVEPPAATHTIEIRDFAYAPARLDVAPGATVVWINRDAAPHTATGSSGGWDSGELETGASWTWVAPEAGHFPYLCAYHPSMEGEVRVREGAPAHTGGRDE